MKSSYSLKKFKDSSDPDLLRALKIYSQNIETSARTDTREILHWVDNYNKKYDDNFFVLGFFVNGVLAGYCELAYFLTDKLVVIDYLIIDKKCRKNNTFYEFIDHIQEFLSKENFEISFVVGEVGFFVDAKEPTEESKNLIRLLKMAHFGVIKTGYRCPMLGVRNYESDGRAVLMVYSPNERITKIKKERYLSIIETIYFKHYGRWYNEFLNDEDRPEYFRHLNTLYDEVKIQIAKKEFIEVNGYSNLFPVNSERIERPLNRKLLLAAIITTSTIGLAILLGMLSLFVKEKVGMDVSSQATMLIGGLILTISFLAVFWTKESRLMSRILDKILPK